jgi:hypothetical protein
MKFQSKAYKRARAQGYRSGLEEKVAAELKLQGIVCKYESYSLEYTIPETKHKYTPDFPLPNGILVETKGEFTSSDRKKHKRIREQHPDLDIRFVFSNPHRKIGAKSSTTYAMWCERLGIPWADKSVPEAWIREIALKSRLMALITAEFKRKAA